MLTKMCMYWWKIMPTICNRKKELLRSCVGRKMKWYLISVHAFKKWNYQMEKSFGTPKINCHSDKENPLIDLKKKEFKINTQH